MYSIGKLNDASFVCYIRYKWCYSICVFVFSKKKNLERKDVEQKNAFKVCLFIRLGSLKKKYEK